MNPMPRRVLLRYAHYDTSGDVYLPVMLNSLVHVVMYGYYFCGASGFTFQSVRRNHRESLPQRSTTNALDDTGGVLPDPPSL